MEDKIKVMYFLINNLQKKLNQINVVQFEILKLKKKTCEF